MKYLTVLIVASYLLTSYAQGCDVTVQGIVGLPAILQFPTCGCSGDYKYTMDGDDFEADRRRTFVTCRGIFIAKVSELDQGKYTLTTGHCEMTVCLDVIECKYQCMVYVQCITLNPVR